MLFDLLLEHRQLVAIVLVAIVGLALLRWREADRQRALQADIEAELRAADLDAQRPVITHAAIKRGQKGAA